TFEGHLNSVLKVQFVSLGMQLLSAGSDGLVKLWTIKDNSCIWALAAPKSERLFVSGGADATFTVWEDFTSQAEEEESRDTELRVEREQELSNCLARKDFVSAVVLCMELDQPFRLLRVLEDLKKSNPEPASTLGLQKVDHFVKTLDKTRLQQLLRYIRDWNTSNRHSGAAQLVLNVVVRSYPPSELLALPGIKELIEGMMPYTERHYAHADELLKRSHILGFTLARMDDFLGI
ncbi:U3 small nucleolar RNA-associated protein 13, partial [Cladochytrium tenue]